MDGISRWTDNIMIERWFRTIKYDEVYLKDYKNIKDMCRQIGEFIHTYYFEELHSALGCQTPAESYYPAMLIRRNLSAKLYNCTADFTLRQAIIKAKITLCSLYLHRRWEMGNYAVVRHETSGNIWFIKMAWLTTEPL